MPEYAFSLSHFAVFGLNECNIRDRVRITDGSIGSNSMVETGCQSIIDGILVLKDRVKGFTIPSTSCSWVCSSIGIRNMVHEFLHMANVGPLWHTIKDSSNIMFPTVATQSTRLRYRTLEEIKYDNTYRDVRQWHELISND